MAVQSDWDDKVLFTLQSHSPSQVWYITTSLLQYCILYYCSPPCTDCL